MRLIIEVQSYIVVDVPDTNTADDIGDELCCQVETAIHDTPEKGGARHAHIDTHFKVWGEKECDWLDGDDCQHAKALLDARARKAK
jgi:hypothetical protein